MQPAGMPLQAQRNKAGSAENPHPTHTIPFEELTLGLGGLGYGSFKSLERGFWRGREVAVGAVRDGGAAHLDGEVALMERLGPHPHIVAFHGVTNSPCGREHLVTELAPHSSLADALAALDDCEAHIRPHVLLAVAQQVRGPST